MTTNKIKRIKEKVKSWLPAIAGALPLAFLSTACVADSNEACPEDLANENQYALRLNIMAQSSSTRSSESGHVPVTGTETENYINIA